MTEEEVKLLSEKFYSGKATQSERIAFLQFANNLLSQFEKELVILNETKT